MRRQIRIVASSSECPGDTLQLALAARDASSSSTQRLAAFVRRLHVRYCIGVAVLGAVCSAFVMFALAIAGGVSVSEPAETVTCFWAEAPPLGCHEIGHLHLRDELRSVDWIWWRGRWCCIAREVLDLIGLDEIDRRAAAGDLGILWERIAP